MMTTTEATSKQCMATNISLTLYHNWFVMTLYSNIDFVFAQMYKMLTLRLKKIEGEIEFKLFLVVL
jgi:hypothetical protein